MILFTYYKVTCNFTWSSEDSADTYSFASLKGAEEWINNKLDSLRWYSIEGLEAHPCDNDNIDGQIYYSMIYHTFKEIASDVEEDK